MANSIDNRTADTLFQEWFDNQHRLQSSDHWTDAQHSEMCERINALEDQIAAVPAATVRDCMVKIAVIFKDSHVTPAQKAVATEAWVHLGFGDLLFADA